MKFALHPGVVASQNDGRQTYVSATSLAMLYQLAPDEYIVWPSSDRTADAYGFRFGDYLHLYPSPEGRYGRPEEP